ncbi:beta-galactosidase small subunit-related protein [Bifidobacterium commune]|uniref:hypothetical protein n=1 Tax=Bifidobacterium commune TaxID=1505727 RepID=UPI0013566B4C|nr:hypothetical protein [Bifidobacterium commune]
MDNADGRNLLAARLLEQSHEAADDVLIDEDARQICVGGAQWQYVCDKRTGMFSSMVFHNCQLIDRPMEVNIWRTPTDNDMFVRKDREAAGYGYVMTRADEVHVLPVPASATLQSARI